MNSRPENIFKINLRAYLNFFDSELKLKIKLNILIPIWCFLNGFSRTKNRRSQKDNTRNRPIENQPDGWVSAIKLKPEQKSA